MNYYNDFDKGAAAWLRELIKAGLIPNGYVDERSITEVKPADLAGFTQCHFFCGIGGWPLALQLAGVPSTQPLWTGSPPCQPFSVAGKQLAQDDPRHLAPSFLELIAQCRPQLLFGEQVAAAIGKHWLDALLIELEEQDYTCGAAVLPACSVGAPHKRDRLFFGANLELAGADREQQRSGSVRETSIGDVPGAWQQGEAAFAGFCGHIGMADTNDARPQGRSGMPERGVKLPAGAAGMDGELADTESKGQSRRGAGTALTQPSETGGEGGTAGTSPHHRFWAGADWLGCRDGKFRPIEARAQQVVDGFSGGMGCGSDSSLRKALEEIGFPLGTNIPARVARLRGYGNAIVPQCAAEFIVAFRGSLEDLL